VNILLDTHAFLWLTSAPGRFRDSVRVQLRDPDTALMLSVASIWEIALKVGLGKLSLPVPVEDYVRSRMARHGVDVLPIGVGHACRVSELPHHHRDPFDRLLVAQGQLEGVAILTADRAFSLYDVETIPAS
jgi:PIN domain nuclease of toxin-antitoxin system